MSIEALKASAQLLSKIEDADKNDLQFTQEFLEKAENNVYISTEIYIQLRMKLSKYTGSLVALGAVLPAVNDLRAQAKEADDSLRKNGSIQLEKGRLVLKTFHPQNFAIAKSVPGAFWNEVQKHWEFPVGRFLLLSKIFPDFDFDPIAIEGSGRPRLKVKEQAIRQVANQLTSAEIDLALSSIDLDAPLKNGWNLHSHQKEGIEWLIRRPKSILADKMGLGKTLTALMAAKAWHIAIGLKVVIICPASVKDNWKREANAIAGVPLEGIYSWAKLPEAINDDFILLADEAHYAQAGAKSKRGKQFLKLSRSPHCRAIIPITGTPMKNGRPINQLPLLQAIGHEVASNAKLYEIRYCNAGPTAFCAWDTSGASNLDELAKRTSDSILRRKKDCLKLPSKTRINVAVEPSSKAKKVFDDRLTELRRCYEERLESGEIQYGGEALVELGHYRLANSLLKAEQAIDIARASLEDGEPIVVFTDFVESAETIHAALGGELLTGKVPVTLRQGLVDNFQSGKSNVFVSTIKAGGVGITLTKASTVLLVDRPWTPGDTEQAEDRCDRIGQTKPVFAFWLQYGEIDVKVDAILAKKQERINLMLDGKRKTLRGVDTSPQGVAQNILEKLLRKAKS
jgi:SNF2 family DNA or RNA helicase